MLLREDVLRVCARLEFEQPRPETASRASRSGLPLLVGVEIVSPLLVDEMLRLWEGLCPTVAGLGEL